jgi:TonB-dependent receptor
MIPHNLFKKKILSSCVAAIALTTVGAQAQNDPEEIVVTGIRASLTRAVDIKRDASSVVDSISAEDIGKLPDTTIADSLQRVSGIQIRRSAGEGSTVNVRGLPQVSTQLNGESFLSPGSITSQQPNFSDIPAELLSGVDVLKSSEAKTLSGGVAGTINLKTRRPLDLKDGWTFAGSAEGTDGSFTDKTGSKLAGFAGFNDGDFGAIFTVSQSKATLANYRYGMFSDWWFRGLHEDGSANWPGFTPAKDLNGDGDTKDSVFSTVDYGVTNKTSERERTGASASFQFKPTDKLELIADVFYTKLDQYDRTNGVVADNAWSEWDWISPVQQTNRGVAVGGTANMDFITSNKVNLYAPRVTAKAESQVEKEDSTNINLQANYQFTDNFKASARIIHADATHNHTGDFADAFITSGQQHGLYSVTNGVKSWVNPGGEYDPTNPKGRILVQADMSGEHPTFTYPTGFGDNISKYSLVSTFSEHNYDNDASLDVFRADGVLTFEENNSLEFGYRYGKRDISTRDYDLAAPFTRNDKDGNPVTAYAKWKDTSGLISGKAGDDTIGRQLSFTELQNMGYIHTVSDFGPASDGNSYYFINPEVMDDPMKFQNSLYPGNIKVTNWNRSYKLTEDTHTAYIQANLAGEFGVPYKANFGIQAIQTILDITNYGGAPTSTVDVDGKTVNAIMGTPGPKISTTETRRDDLDLLPRFNISFDIAEDQKLRFSYTKTLTQLDGNDLGLGTSYTTNYNPTLNTFVVVNATSDGNPNMKPWRSDNYDVSYEWYFNDVGLLSFGIYRLDIKSFIGTQTTKLYGVPDLDGVVRNNGIDFTQKANVDGGVLQGFEIGYQQAYDFLPGILSGLGSSINYTYSDSQGGDKDFYGQTMPMGDNSKKSLNAILWYQKDGWQARVAYNYRSERYIGRSWNDGSPAAWWASPTSYVDASVSYDINDNFTVYLQGTNITEEYENTYMQWKDVMVNQNVYEARYTLGVRAKF